MLCCHVRFTQVEKQTLLSISGNDKVAVGNFCATIRFQKPPEPYKGKGIRFEGEKIKLKEGKSAGGKKK
jgi:large subunit ribosomal protein L6